MIPWMGRSNTNAIPFEESRSYLENRGRGKDRCAVSPRPRLSFPYSFPPQRVIPISLPRRRKQKGGREDLLLLQAAGSSLHRYALGTDRSDRYGVCHSQQSIDQPLEPSPQPSSFQFHSQSRILEICLLHYGKLLTMVVFGLWKWDHDFPDLCCRSASVNGSWQVEFEIFISIFGKFLEYLESFLPSDGSFGGRCLGSFVDVDQIYGGWN